MRRWDYVLLTGLGQILGIGTVKGQTLRHHAAKQKLLISVTWVMAQPSKGS
jgi:hypothetical protein